MIQNKQTKTNLILLLVGVVVAAGMIVGWSLAMNALSNTRAARLACYLLLLCVGVGLVELAYAFFAGFAMNKLADQDTEGKYRFLFGTRLLIAVVVCLVYAAVIHGAVVVVFGKISSAYWLVIPAIAKCGLAVFAYLLIMGNTVQHCFKSWVRVLIDVAIIGGGIGLSFAVSLNLAVLIMVAVKVIVMVVDVLLNYKKKELVFSPIGFLVENVIYAAIPCVVMVARRLTNFSVGSTVANHILSTVINMVIGVVIAFVLIMMDSTFRKELGLVLKKQKTEE